MSNRLLRRDHRTPTLDLNFLGMSEETFDKRITFSRTSHATMFDATGKLTFAPNNLILQSNAFTTTWANTACDTPTAQPTGYVDGSVAWSIKPNTANSEHYIRQQSLSAPAGNILVTVRAKADGYNFVSLIMSDSAGFTNYTEEVFNLNTGATETTGRSGGTWTSTAAIRSLGSGWYECTMVAQTTGVTDRAGFGVCSTSTPNASFVGDTTSGILVANFQIERVTYETSPRPYNPTTTAAYYGPRLEYDPVTLAAKGLLVEEVRTNLFIRSEEFDNATAWPILGGISAVSAGSTTSPSGVGNAETIAATATNNTHLIYQTVSSTTSGANYAMSVFCKKGTHPYICIGIFNGAHGVQAVFDLDGTSGAATQTGVGSSSGTIVSTSQTSVGNGWLRLSIVGSSTTTTLYPFISFAPAATGNTFAANGGVTSNTAGTETFYLWGAQLEAGSFPTSYIPTTTASATRAGDTAYIGTTNTTPGAFGTTGYNQFQGTFLVNASAQVKSFARFIAVKGSVNNSRILTMQFGGNAFGQTQVVGVEQGAVTLAAITAGANLAFTHTYRENDFAGSYNGGVVVRDTAGSLPLDSHTFYIGGELTADFMTGHISRISYWPFRMRDTELRARSVR